MSAEYAYATLEEAFGVRSFLAPDPPVLRGEVAQISDARYKRFDEDVKQSHVAAMGTPVSATPPRTPVEATKCGIVIEGIAQAHTQGGAKAAWAMVPDSARCDMMWYAVREFITSDFVTMLLVAMCLYLLLR